MTPIKTQKNEKSISKNENHTNIFNCVEKAQALESSLLNERNTELYVSHSLIIKADKKFNKSLGLKKINKDERTVRNQSFQNSNILGSRSPYNNTNFFTAIFNLVILAEILVFLLSIIYIISNGLPIYFVYIVIMIAPVFIGLTAAIFNQ